MNIQTNEHIAFESYKTLFYSKNKINDRYTKFGKFKKYRNFCLIELRFMIIHSVYSSENQLDMSQFFIGYHTFIFCTFHE